MRVDSHHRAHPPEPADDLATEAEDDAPTSAYRAFARDLGGVCARLRDDGGLLSELDSCAWQIFLAIALSWSRHDVTPLRRMLTKRAGLSAREVTRQLRVLCVLGVVRLRRSPGGPTEYRIGEFLEKDVVEHATVWAPSTWRSTVGTSHQQGSSPASRATPQCDTLAPQAIPLGDTLAPQSIPPHEGGDTLAPQSIPLADTLAPQAIPPHQGAGTLAPQSIPPPAEPGYGRPTLAPQAIPPRGVGVPQAQRGDGLPTLFGDLRPISLRAAIATVTDGTRAPPAGGPARATLPAQSSPFKRKDLRSFSSDEGLRTPPARDGASAPGELGAAERSDEAADRAAACQALLGRHRRLHPETPLPRTFNPEDVAVVVRCAAEGGWARQRFAEMSRDAVEGAIARSPDRAPTIRFIWGKVEHFTAHVERGRAARLAGERRKANRAPPAEAYAGANHA